MNPTGYIFFALYFLTPLGVFFLRAWRCYSTPPPQSPSLSVQLHIYSLKTTPELTVVQPFQSAAHPSKLSSLISIVFLKKLYGCCPSSHPMPTHSLCRSTARSEPVLSDPCLLLLLVCPWTQRLCCQLVFRLPFALQSSDHAYPCFQAVPLNCSCYFSFHIWAIRKPQLLVAALTSKLQTRSCWFD